MIIGSHNAWSYLTPRRWWMKLFSFMAKCQNVDIRKQYNNYGVRCFDLRLRFKKGLPVICHGLIEYKYSYEELLEDLKWLDSKGDVTIRLLLDLRGTSRKNWSQQKKDFNLFYISILHIFYPNFTYIVGRSLPDWDKIIKTILEGSVSEDYASVCAPKYIDDWIPILYAKWHNKISRNKKTDRDILLLDFVDI